MGDTFVCQHVVCDCIATEVDALRKRVEELERESQTFEDQAVFYQARAEKAEKAERERDEFARKAVEMELLWSGTNAELEDAQEHEKQTHQQLGAILGTDDALHVVAQRMRDRADKLQAERDSYRRDFDAAAHACDTLQADLDAALDWIEGVGGPMGRGGYPTDRVLALLEKRRESK